MDKKDEIVDVSLLLPGNHLDGRIRILLDQERRPVRIEKNSIGFKSQSRRTVLTPSVGSFSENFVKSYLVGEKVTEEDYERYIKPHITYLA